MATQSSTLQQTKTDLQEPKKYNVVFHNDDFTPMQFVVQILISIFHKSEAEAESIMMAVHTKGMAVAACLPYDLAHSSASEATRRARSQSYPLKITVEEA